MTGKFIITKEHRRFTEFAHVVRKEHTIGICYGDAGVGKTMSGRRYANWDTIEPHLGGHFGPRNINDKVVTAAGRARSVFYTPPVTAGTRNLTSELKRPDDDIDLLITQHLDDWKTLKPTSPSRVELIIIDESERLSATALEMLRDLHDRTRVAVVLIGMPGLDQRFRHYPQLFSRLGFAHNYQPLTTEELMFVLDRQWKRLGRELDAGDFTDHQAVAAIARITRGNFRLLERLFPQIARVLKINELDTITDDVIEAAASTLVIG
jgi:DNA transposition AAA+ family ATPase